jgi:branched-chain amino acid transport system ATP-binding protein
MPLFEVNKLRVSYQKVEAVKGISLHMETGDFICLIGANGAGKTTTLRAISGLKSPAAGEIVFDGVKLNGLSPIEIAARGIIQVPEGRRIFPQLTVLENLHVGAYLIRDKRVVAQRLERVYQRFPKLSERRGQTGGSLSGGEQQMLAFGRALMANPRLLLLDEPTLGLAPIMVQECAKFASSLNREGISIILVEQNAKLALAISKRAYVMETGSVVLEGPCLEIMRSEKVKKHYMGA